MKGREAFARLVQTGACPYTRGVNNERSAVNREQIVTVALTIADRDGLDGLTMRKLSAELEVSPPVVYRHFKDKAEIVTGIVEQLLSGPDIADTSAMPWREWLEGLFKRTHSELRAHPGVLPLLASTETFIHHALGVTESALSVLREAGLDGKQAGRAFRLLMSFTVGQLLIGKQAMTAVESIINESDTMDFMQKHPNVAAAGAELSRIDDEWFHDGLSTLLDSIEREIAATRG